jgi:endonuclease/exonuclease/phosphatase family metal-dependent hydrolase
VKAWLAAVLLFGACREAKDDPPIDEVDAPEGTPDARSSWPDGTPHSPNEVWIQTWNIETFPKTAQAPQMVAEILTQVNADLVAVQEIRDVAAFSQLDETLPQYERVLPLDDPGSDDSIVGLLYQPGTVAISEVETLFSGDWYAFPRLPVKLRASVNGIDFTIVVVHLKARLDDESEARRRDACAKLDTWVRAELAENVERDVIILGDWNDELTDATADNVFQVFLNDTATYRFLTLPQAQGGEYTFIPFQSMLDHALITTDMETELGAGDADILELDQSVDGYSTNVSDHRPVLIKLKP